MGIGNIDGIEYLPKAEKPIAATARMREIMKKRNQE